MLVSILFVLLCLHASAFRLGRHSKSSVSLVMRSSSNDANDESYSSSEEPIFSISYDPLEPPNQLTYERDLEDKLMERSLRFYDKSTVRKEEKCYLVGLEDRSLLNGDNSNMDFSLEESLTELSELAGAAGLTVVGSTYQRLSKPSIEYYIGQGKTKEICKSLSKLKCTCVIFDTELTPSQQKNLETVLNQDSKDTRIKVIDRTALILDIFAQHARTKEGQLQVQLALLTYRLPRLTNMWTHLERQSAGSKGRSNGGVGLRGPGEKQLESDKRQMKVKISVLNRAIDSVRRHRSSHRRRRRQLGVPVVALVGYTNAGKSTLLNTITQTSDVFASDMLFATLDPTTRLVRMPGMQFPDMLLTDTVGFIQKLPTNLVAAFRATLEEICEADVLLHVSDITNDAWRKQECAVLNELTSMGLESKPLVRVWNKIDIVNDQKEYWKYEANKTSNTVAISCHTREGMADLQAALQQAICSTMEEISCVIPYTYTSFLNTLHSLGSLESVLYEDDGIYVKGRLPGFLVGQIESLHTWDELDEDENDGVLAYNKNIDDEITHALDTSSTTTTTIENIHVDNDDEDNDDEYDEVDDENNSGNTGNFEILGGEYRIKKVLDDDGNEVDWKHIAKGRHSITINNGNRNKNTLPTSSQTVFPMSQSFQSSSSNDDHYDNDNTLIKKVNTDNYSGVVRSSMNTRRPVKNGSSGTKLYVETSMDKKIRLQSSLSTATSTSTSSSSVSSGNSVRITNNEEDDVIDSSSYLDIKKKMKTTGKTVMKYSKQSKNKPAAEQYNLEDYGLSADGLLDFDAGEYGHHANTN